MTAHAYPINLSEPPGGAFDHLEAPYQNLYRASGMLDRLYSEEEMAEMRARQEHQHGWDEAFHREADPFGHYRHHPCRATSIVYFAGRGGIVKIGHSKDVPHRLAELTENKTVTPAGQARGVVTLLGFYEGGHRTEQALHREFATARLAGEWFTLTAALREHIRDIEYPSWVAAP